MKVGDSGHYAFKRISKRHYAETAKKCGINEDMFNKIIEELKHSYENLNIKDNELDPFFNRETLEIILEGMEIRAKVLFEQSKK